MTKAQYLAEPKPVAEMTPAPNASTGGKLYTALLKIAAHGSMGHLPLNQGFYEVATYNSRSSAASTVTNIKQGKRKIPEGRWSFSSRGDTKTNTSVLYAKYIGPDNHNPLVAPAQKVTYQNAVAYQDYHKGPLKYEDIVKWEASKKMEEIKPW